MLIVVYCKVTYEILTRTVSSFFSSTIYDSKLMMKVETIKATTDWVHTVPSKEKHSYAIKNLVISPDGDLFVASSKNRVLLCNCKDGSTVESLLGHKETIKSLSFSFKGDHFASGGLDNVVVIWKRNGEGLLKYTHSSPVQLVAFSPSSLRLLSAAETDFGIWSPDQKQVAKVKTEARVSAACWSLDGASFAMGFESGEVSIRLHTGEETVRFQRAEAVRCLHFMPGEAFRSNSSTDQYIVVGSWDQTISLYHVREASVKGLYERTLAGYPLCMCLAGLRQDSFIVSMSTGKSSLFSKEGVLLADLIARDAWTWSHSYNSSNGQLLIGSEEGVVESYSVKYGPVESLCRERFAYRENLTEVIIQNLVTQKKVRIKCKDLVHSIALHQNKVAIQLSDKVCVYECEAGDEADMHYRLRKDKISVRSDRDGVKNVLLTSTKLLVVKAATIELYTFECVRCRVWQLESPVTCLCPGGGPEGGESFFIGCADGTVVKIFVNNAVTTEIWKCSKELIGLDASIDKSKLACVDVSGSLSVLDVKTQRVVYAASDVCAAHYNSEVDGMLCFCNGSQFVQVVICSFAGSVNESGSKTTGIVPLEVEVDGRVVGFRGRQILSRSEGALLFADVPQSSNISRAVQRGDYALAHRLACVAGTESDWRRLAMKALHANELDVAKKCFVRLQDVRFLTFIDWATKGHSLTASPETCSRSLTTALDPVWQAELLAIEHSPLETAKMYNRLGRPQDAVRVLTDLRMYDEAKGFAQSAGLDTAAQSELVSQQAEWLLEERDWRGAADLYISLGFLLRGAKILATHELPGWDAKLIELVRGAPVDANNELLIFCAETFDSRDRHEYAAETYKKLGHVERLIALYAARHMWKEAVDLAERHPGKFDPALFVPHAHWLVAGARYDEAVSAFTRAGRDDLGIATLSQLVQISINRRNFGNASHYSWKLALYMSKGARSSQVFDISEWELKSNIYYAYSKLHTSGHSTGQLNGTFQASLYILNLLSAFRERFEGRDVAGVREALVLGTLGCEATRKGAYKLARQAYERLAALREPKECLDEMEVNLLSLLTKPPTDERSLLPLCRRCGSTNSLLNPSTDRHSGDCCTHCGHAFVRSFVNFEILPLVEFVPPPEMSHEHAIELIRQQPDMGSDDAIHQGYVREEAKVEGPGAPRDRFKEYLDHGIDSPVVSSTGSIAVVDSLTLQEMPRSEVFVCQSVGCTETRYRYYKIMDSTVRIALSQPCSKFFVLEDFEFEYLSQKRCPFSYVSDVGDYGSL